VSSPSSRWPLKTSPSIGSGASLTSTISTGQPNSALTKSVYAKLSPWQISQVARLPQRPYTLDYIAHIFTDFRNYSAKKTAKKLNIDVLRNVAQNPSDSLATVCWQTEQTDLHPGQPIKFIDAGKRSGAKNSILKTGCTIALSLQQLLEQRIDSRWY
jgi:hypothetical protein